jgi:outer membrane biosynthesis protein TonB
MSAKDVAEKAKAAGLEISTEYIYKVRSRLGTKAAKKPAAPGKPATTVKPKAAVAKPKAPTPKPAPAPKPVASTSGTDEVVSFRRLVLSLGVTRSRQLLDELERGLAALIGG